MQQRITILLASLLLMGSAAMTAAAPKYPDAVIPDTVEKQSITIWSDGRPLDGDLYRPKNLEKQQLVPAIVTSHGWGGDKKTAARYAAKFAQNGFIALAFSHSSWGDSGGNLLFTSNNTASNAQPIESGNVHVVKKLIDPVDWVQNLRSAVDYLEGEPNVDSSKIGAWGTSFGGGIVISHAVTDERIAAIVTQVAAFPTLDGAKLAHAKRRAVETARGKIPAIPEGIDGIPGLDGTPHMARFLQYKPMEKVASITIPTLLIAAEKEQLFKNELNSGKAYKELRRKGNVDTAYEVIPKINHYGIYFDGYEKGSKLALAWFERTLKD